MQQAHVEDHYRRRLTHTLEVAQIATTVARALRLNEVATEAIALGHDLGHTPFGHAGEDRLNELMRKARKGRGLARGSHSIPVFGFDHCVHAIEVVSRIEKEYRVGASRHYGLNLSFDVRDGILKHMFDRAHQKRRPFSDIASVVPFDAYRRFGDNKGSLEAQCVYFADKVAYLFGDIEDGLRSRLLGYSQINDTDLLALMRQTVKKLRRVSIPAMSNIDEFLRFRRQALAALILNCIETAQQRISETGFSSVDDVLACRLRIVTVSDNIDAKWREFHRNTMEGKLYKDSSVSASVFKAKKIIEDLFKAYNTDHCLIHHEYRDNSDEAYQDLVPNSRMRDLIAVRNYIAGMTDSFATEQHKRLYMSSELVRF